MCLASSAAGQREYLVVRVVGKTPRPAETTTRHCQSGSEGRSFGADPDRRFLGLCYGVQTRSLASCLRHQPRQEPRALTRMRGSVRGDWRKPVPYRDVRQANCSELQLSIIIGSDCNHRDFSTELIATIEGSKPN